MFFDPDYTAYRRSTFRSGVGACLPSGNLSALLDVPLAFGCPRDTVGETLLFVAQTDRLGWIESSLVHRCSCGEYTGVPVVSIICA